jgi:hypothetical protein
MTTLRERIQLLICVDSEIQEILWTENQVQAFLRIGRMLAELSTPEAKMIVMELVAQSRKGGQ